MRNVCIMTEDERNLHTSEQHKLTERFITLVTLTCIDLACKNWYVLIPFQPMLSLILPLLGFWDSFESLSKYIMHNGTCTLKIEIIV